jgi:alpha-glucan,water dikinase
MHQAPGASRDLLLLDIALENYFRLCLERTDKGSLSGDDLCELVALSLRSSLVALDSEDLHQVIIPETQHPHLKL